MTPLIVIGILAAIISAAAVNLIVESDPECRSEQVKRVLSKQRISLPVSVAITSVLAFILNVAYGLMSGNPPMLPFLGAVLIGVQSASLREENKFDPLLFITLMLSPRIPDPNRAQLREEKRKERQAQTPTFSFSRPAFSSPRRKTLRGEEQIKSQNSK